MSIGMNIALILALALAAIGSSTRDQADVSNRPAEVRGLNLNHNETLVRDAAPPQRADDWSLWLSAEQAFATTSLLSQFLSYRDGASCSPWVCGANHNETLVRDLAPPQRADDLSLWLGGKQSFAAASLLSHFLFYRAGVNLNHSETLVRDEAAPQRADDWSLWLSSEQSFAAASLLRQFLFYRVGSGCNPMVCGANHNETLVRDAGPME